MALHDNLFLSGAVLLGDSLDAYGSNNFLFSI